MSVFEDKGHSCGFKRKGADQPSRTSGDLSLTRRINSLLDDIALARGSFLKVMGTLLDLKTDVTRAASKLTWKLITHL